MPVLESSEAAGDVSEVQGMVTGFPTDLAWLIGALVISLILLLLIRWLENAEVVPSAPPTIHTETFGSPAWEAFLKKYANWRLAELPEEILPLHPEIHDFLTHYRSVRIRGVELYHRNYILEPYPNPEFVQIGHWELRGDVLVRRDAADPGIYLAKFIGNGEPRLFAASLQAYFHAAWSEWTPKVCYAADDRTPPPRPCGQLDPAGDRAA